MNFFRLIYRRLAWVTCAVTLTWLLAIPAVQAFTIQELLDAVAEQPGMIASELTVRQGGLQVEAADAKLSPTVDLFGRFESYNSPTNLRPMPPTEINLGAGDSAPFSREILRYGLSFEAPLYVAAILRLREKSRLLARKSEIAHLINLISRQATVVSLNSGLAHLDKLMEAVDGRLASLAKTRNDVEIKVNNGRTAGAELLKIENSILDLKQQQNDLTDKSLTLRRDLEKLTGLDIQDPAPMALIAPPEAGEFIAADLKESELAVREKEVARLKARRLPSVLLFGNVSGNDGEAYNTDEHIFRPYNMIGIGLKMPLFDRTMGTDERLATIAAKKAGKELAELEIELAASEKNLRRRLPLAKRSLRLAEEALANNNKLLAIARVAYDAGRTTTEEYLRYEAEVLASQAQVARAVDNRWQIIAQQAVLYGADLKEVLQ